MPLYHRGFLKYCKVHIFKPEYYSFRINKDSVKVKHSEQAWPSNEYLDPSWQYSTPQSPPYQTLSYSNPSSDWTPIKLNNNNIVKDKVTTRYSENLGNSLIDEYKGGRTKDYTDQYYEYNDYDEYNISDNDSEVYDTSKLLTGKNNKSFPHKLTNAKHF